MFSQMRIVGRLHQTAAIALCAALLAPAAATGAPLPADLNGDGGVDIADEALFTGFYGTTSASSTYDAGADLNADGAVDVGDLAILGAATGTTGGDVDVTPPDLFITVNSIPDDMNDVIVVPPDSFLLTLTYDRTGGSLVDPASLVVTSDQDLGPLVPPGTNVGPLFLKSAAAALLAVPVGSDLARTTHTLSVSIDDHAGNQAAGVYPFAVRDFTYGAPLGSLQTFFLDFDQDRTLGPEIDFIEDLREFGLSSTADPTLETLMQGVIIGEIVARVHPYFGRNADGSPAADASNVVFSATNPGGTYSRICVGGESSLGGSYLGASTIDVHNQNTSSDECGVGAQRGIFPHALDNLWGSDPDYLDAFSPVDSGLGGTPVGEDPLDAVVLAPGFDIETATPEQLDRLVDVANATDAFAQAIASAIAHEAGHLVGLTAPGDAPAGLYGGTSGGEADHNVNTSGSTPIDNFLMNRGSAFTFAEMTGSAGEALPTFRPLSWAYLRDRVALNDQVTGLYPAPTLADVQPNPANYQGGQQTVPVTFTGTGFLATPVIELLAVGDPTPNPVLSVQWVDAQTVTGVLNVFVHLPDTYDVHFINADGQEVTYGQQLVVGVAP